MVFKCCVVNCRTNYDTQPRKYPVFAFPSQPELRKQWLEKIETKSQKVTHSSRVCVKHFKPEDIRKSNKQRSILAPNSVPVGNEHVIESDSESEKEEIEEYRVVEEAVEAEDIIEETGLTFEEFVMLVEERQDVICEHWNIYSHPKAIVFYRLGTFDENLNDVSFSLKIIVTSNMKVKLCKGDSEASGKELGWAFEKETVINYEQFEEFLNYYHHEPAIITKNEPLKHLSSAFDHLEQVEIDSLHAELENCRAILYSLLQSAQQVDEEYLKLEKIEKFDEVIDETPQQIIDEGSHYDEPMEGMEEIVVDESEKNAKLPSTDQPTDFKENLKNALKKQKEKTKVATSPSPTVAGSSIKYGRSRKYGIKKEVKFFECSFCYKIFKSPYTRKEHEKTHSSNPELEEYLMSIEGHPRYACPKCPLHFEFSFMLKKHIDGNCQAYEKKRKYRYPCPKCDREFPTKISAANHASEAHKIEIGNLEKWCFECNGEFDDYVTHIRIHSCQFSCSFCGSRFLTEEKMLAHQSEKHWGEKKEDRQFKCTVEGCGLSFKHINHLRSHMLAMHTKTRRDFQCEQCPKSFSQKSLLNAHIRTHSQIGIFNCNVTGCTRRFKKLMNLKEHAMRDHNEPNIYLCKFDDCEERFKMLFDLKIHCQETHDRTINIQKYFDNP